MKKFFILLKVIRWLVLALMIVVSLFALAAVIITRHQLVAELGRAIVLGTFAAVAAMLFLFIWWICRGYGVRSTVIAFAGFALLIALFYAEEDFRGWHAWQSFKHQSEAKGEKLDFASVVPPPVPDGQNFALSDVVASSYEYILDKHGHRITPSNTNVVNRLAMNIYRNDNWERQPTNSYWAKGTLTDLKAWQAYYRIPNTNSDSVMTNEFPVALEPQAPAVDVLLALSKFDSTVEELRQASKLPFSRYPINYNSDPICGVLLPHLAGTKRCAQHLALRGEAELELGQSEKALADIELGFRVIDSMRQEPFLISHLVRIAEFSIILQPVYEGLARHQWSESELVELERELAKFDFLADYQLSMRGERNESISTIDYLRRHRSYNDIGLFDWSINSGEIKLGNLISETLYALIPTGWFFLNEASIGRFHERWFLPMVEPQKHLIHPKIPEQADAALSTMHRTPENFIVAILMPALSVAELKFGYGQSAVDMARVGCALERYRIAHGEYPTSLTVLSPQFIESVPNDVVGGQPLKYRRTGDGRFVLYSIGWNEIDDGGKIGLRPSGSPDMRTGDWVWQYETRVP